MIYRVIGCDIGVSVVLVHKNYLIIFPIFLEHNIFVGFNAMEVLTSSPSLWKIVSKHTQQCIVNVCLS